MTNQTTAAAPTAAIAAMFAALVGTAVSVVRFVRLDQRINGDEITWLPVHRTEAGIVDSVDTHAERVTVTLRPAQEWDGDNYLGGRRTVTLTGSDHPLGSGTSFAVAAA